MKTFEENMRICASKLEKLARDAESLEITPGDAAWELFEIVEVLIHEANMSKE